MDIQGREIDERRLRHFVPPKENAKSMEKDLAWIVSELTKAKRPVILAGQGVALSECQKPLARLAKRLGAPVVTSFLGGNSMSAMDDHYIGRIGTKGCRAANIAVANADFLLVLGCRLSVSTTGHEYDLFARYAKTVVVDIDGIEHSKNTVRIDRLVKVDLKAFLPKLANKVVCNRDRRWLKRCNWVKQRYPIVSGKAIGEGKGVSLYDFVGAVNIAMRSRENWSVVSDAGSSFYVTTQAIETSGAQRYITSGGQAEMGFSLPAAIGSAAAGARKVIAISGDGSLQMNIQEFQTLLHYQLPVKLFVWNNDGYLSIRATQRKFFGGRLIGTDSSCGVSFPSLSKVAKAYGLRYVRIGSKAELPRKMSEVLRGSDPVVCEVMCMRDEVVAPSISSVKLPSGQMKSMPPEDMYPFLPWDEFKELMVVPVVERS